MDDDHKRWKIRFEKYTNAFNKLKEAIEQNELNELERNGLIQRFEFTIDLSWKVMKYFLLENGFHLNLRQRILSGLHNRLVI